MTERHPTYLLEWEQDGVRYIAIHESASDAAKVAEQLGLLRYTIGPVRMLK